MKASAYRLWPRRATTANAKGPPLCLQGNFQVRERRLRGKGRHAASCCVAVAMNAVLGRTSGSTRGLTRMGIPAVEFLPVDVLVSLVSAAVLRNPRVLPLHAARS